MSIDLNAIQKPNQNLPPPLVFIHGGAGIGKTTFGMSDPNSILIPTEQGLAGIQRDSFPLQNTPDGVLDCFRTLYKEQHNYTVACFDSTTSHEPNIWREVVAIENKGRESKRKPGYESIEDIGYAKGYIYSLPYWEKLIAAARALRDHKGMTVVFIAHTLVKRFNNPNGSDYDQYQISLHEKAADLLKREFDVVGFANYEVSVIKSDANAVKGKAQGSSVRTLYLQETPAFIAKARSGYAIETEIPFTWNDFINNIGYPKKEEETNQ